MHPSIKIKNKYQKITLGFTKNDRLFRYISINPELYKTQMSLHRLAEILFENVTREGSLFKEGEYVESMNIIRDINTRDEKLSRVNPTNSTSTHYTPFGLLNTLMEWHWHRRAPTTPVRAHRVVIGETTATINLTDLNVPHLKKICKYLRIRGYSTKRKSEIIILIREALDKQLALRNITLQQSLTNINNINFQV
jgi:hypothetical protein